MVPALLLLLLLPGSPHASQHERILLLHQINFCDPGSYHIACRHDKGRYKDFYCSPQLSVTRDLLTGYCTKHAAWQQQQQQQQAVGAAAAIADDGHKYLIASHSDNNGWGNRLQGFAAGFLLALLTNRTFLISSGQYAQYFEPPLNFTVPWQVLHTTCGLCSTARYYVLWVV